MAIPSRIVTSFVLLSLLAAAAVGAWLYLLRRPGPPDLVPAETLAESPPVWLPLAYEPVPIGLPVEGHPVITQVAIADLDADGLADVLVCDAGANRIGWIRQSPRGVFTETALGDPIAAPARVIVCDLNQDRLPDLLVAGMGTVRPNNDRIGQIVVLENLGENRFRNRVLADHIARVTDVRVADLNADGRPDVVAAGSGWDDGDVGWMENLGGWEFRNHIVTAAAGAVAVPVADYDRDGTVDLAVLFAREHEEIRLFRNGSGGEFHEVAVWKAGDESWGGSGLEACDLNRDGQPDLLCSNGDGFNAGYAQPSPRHGLQWLENRGGTFEYHRIGPMPGCYSPVTADLDGDGDGDVVTVSACNQALDPEAVGMTAWLNDGHQNFRPLPLARDPTRFITVAAGDLDGAGGPVLVTGGFHAYPPFTRMSRVTLWRRLPPEVADR